VMVVLHPAAAAVSRSASALPVVSSPVAAQVTHPLPTAAAAGDASTGDQMALGGAAGFAAFLVLGGAMVLRRRDSDA
jgi:LPXTG-motif cell wall-anchored protein